jgi:PhnB protein
MSSTLNPYLAFRDNAREAMAFYHDALGGTLTQNTFADFGLSDEPGEKDKIMHSQLKTDAGFTLMGADTPAHEELNEGNNVTISISGEDEAELRGYWDKLAVGATVAQPLQKAPWGDTFGMLTDKYGVGWLIDVVAAESE